MKNEQILEEWNAKQPQESKVGFCSLPFSENSPELPLIVEASVAQFGGWLNWKWTGGALSSIQSLFYGISISNMYEEQGKFFEHIDLVGGFAQKNSIRYAVFGSPKLRKTAKFGDEALFVEIWQKIADKYPDINWGIEINPAQYGTDICAKYDQTLEVVKGISKKNVLLHFDTGCIEMSGEDSYRLLVEHVANHPTIRIHISEPNMVAYSGNSQKIIDLCIEDDIGISLEQIISKKESNQLFINQAAKAIKNKLKF